MNYKKLLVGLVAGLGVVWLGGYAALFYTPLPMKFVAGLAEKAGIQTAGITGNLTNGVSVQTISTHNENVDIDIQDAGMKHSSIWSQMFQRKYVLEEMHVASAKIIVKKWPERKNQAGQAPGQPVSQAQPKKEEPSREQIEELLSSMDYEAKSIRFKNLEIKTPEMSKSWKVEHFEIKNLVARNRELTLDSLTFKNEGIDLQLVGGKANEQLATIQSIKMAILPGMSPIVIKPVIVEAKAQYGFKPDQATFVEVRAFDGKVVAQMDGQMNVLLQTQDWTPFEYIKTAPPISQVNLKTQTNVVMATMGLSNWTGNFKLGHASFNVQSKDMKGVIANGPTIQQPFLVASSDYNTVRYDLDFFLQPEALLGNPSKGPWVRLKTHKGGSQDQHLAFLLFGKDAKGLGPAEAQYLIQAGTQIAMSAPKTAPVSVKRQVVAASKFSKPGKKVASRAVSSKGRAPASFKKRR